MRTQPSTWKLILLCLVIAEAAIILSLLAIGYKQRRMVVDMRPGKINPLIEAIEFECSDRRFEQLVADNPALVKYRPKDSHPVEGSILSICAERYRTNCVRILIMHGADVPEAVMFLNKAGRTQAVNLVMDVESNLSGVTGAARTP